MKRLLPACIITLALGYAGGQTHKQAAVRAEYTRVVAAIARTMRCQTEDEFVREQDHECAPYEIEQDAGLLEGGSK